METKNLLILGALAAIAIPRISQSAESARISACRTNVDLINSQIELYYANKGEWPEKLDDVVKDPEYFPDGPPACPVDETAYSYDDKTHHVAEHDHSK